MPVVPAPSAPPPPTRADALLEAQAQVLERIVRGSPLTEVLDALCRILETHSSRPVRAAILLVDADGKRLVTGAAPSLPESYCRAIDGIAMAPDVGTCCAAAALNQVVVTRRISTDPAWNALRELPLSLGLEAAWSMPIVSSTGGVLGTFGTYFLEPREPEPEERRLVEVLSRTAALAIERHRADQALQASARRDRFLADLAAATQPLVEPSEVMATTSRMLAEHLGVDRCAYAQIEDERTFVITGDHARGVPSIVGSWPVAAFGPACERRMLAGEAYVVTDAETDPEIAGHQEAFRATNIRAVICVPLHKQGKFTAAMAVHQTTPRRWTDDEIRLVERVCARCWEALERARVTRELRDSEALHRAIVQTTPECVKLVAPDGTLLQMNAAGLRMVEAETEESVLGHCVYDIVAPEHRDSFRALNERVCQGERGMLSFEIVGMRGARLAMETTAVPLALPSGAFAQLAITRDVTARAEADRALAQSRARLEYAVRLSGIGFWYCDLPFDELIWDERVKDHFFIDRDARVTLDLFYERMHPDDRATTREAIEASIRERRSYDVVYRTVNPSSGQIKWIRALGGTTYAADGTPSHFDGVTVDVTQHKLAEARLARVLEGEREQGRLLKQVAAAALKIHASSSVETVLQVTTDEARALIGARQAVSRLGDDESQSTTGSPSSDRRRRLTIPFVGRDGARLGVVELSDKIDGDFTEADEAILVQLAQLAAVALENARLYDRLREQDRRKDEFLATLAHELRNPLAPIRTGLHVLARTPDPQQATETRAVMERQMGHLVRMVDDLLDISRITLGKLTLKRERADLKSVLDSALETTRPLVDAAGHQLVVQLPDAPVTLEADPTRIAQVIANLINNAAKYTPRGGRIELVATLDGPDVMLRVSDNGVGIPPEMLGSVFEMFTQVAHPAERSQGGLGVGLSLVRRLVEMHGGSVKAESAGIGRGSTFIVRLPAVVAADRADRPSAGERSRAPVRETASLRVLVVDDNVDGAESLATLLELGGHQTRVAHAGPEAVTAAKDFRPEVVFLDIGLPGFDGYEVARRLRADPSLPQPVLVALTGWGSSEDRRQAHAAGFDRHLVKPVEVSKVDEVLMVASGRAGAPGLAFRVS